MLCKTAQLHKETLKSNRIQHCLFVFSKNRLISDFDFWYQIRCCCLKKTLNVSVMQCFERKNQISC